MIEEIEAKTLLSRVKYQEWFGASYNMNLYRGCCHGCIYCDSRSECYHVDQFDRVRVKKMPCKSSEKNSRQNVRPPLSESAQ